ncbi:serine/threonine-protein kinase [Bacteroides sp. 224]|uniref:serine/threonine-protein kinase n=1 Tax=Bacteroides sp. 224 TaxID=2302936 RepID=UPI0013D6F422|nr:serine/threonine-protein kinase [Bacteroides sp. 224]NDV65596.1 serine/threonine protein kinase [Bacteroides sp. 224]
MDRVEESGFAVPHIVSLSSPMSYYVGEGVTACCYKVNYYGKWLLMKRLKEEYLQNTLYIAAFRKEFELGVHLDHPNIVRYVDIKEDKEGLCILTEYVDGLTLDEFQKETPTHFKNKVNQKQFITELLAAIEYLHQHQILHLDLKPDNILITRQGNHVKLIDFGFAYQDCYLYQPAGSGKYAAPEQKTKIGNLSPACDIYAIGCILRGIGVGSKEFIGKCTAFNPQKRYQSINEMRSSMLSAMKRRYAVSAFLLIVMVFVFWGGQLIDKTFITAPSLPPVDMNIEQESVKEDVSSAFTFVITPTPLEVSIIEKIKKERDTKASLYALYYQLISTDELLMEVKLENGKYVKLPPSIYEELYKNAFSKYAQ